MNERYFKALCWISQQNEGHEINMADGYAMSAIECLGFLTDRGLLDMVPGIRSPAYFINRAGLRELGETVH